VKFFVLIKILAVCTWSSGL